MAIDGEFRSFKPVPRLRPEVVEDRLREWRRLLRQSTTQGRAVLQRVLRGRITFTPKCGGYEFEAPTRFDKPFLGVDVETKREVSDEGTEHIGPEDTFDADYGRLLEAVQNRGERVGVPKGNRTCVDAKTPRKIAGCGLNAVRLRCKQHLENNALPTRSIRQSALTPERIAEQALLWAASSLVLV